ncbi:MAG: metal-sensitive transcriptional regulator [Anaerolineae bacterium]|nr:metal-sensitive transcriptional regulator [Anaerolineae bacterium]
MLTPEARQDLTRRLRKIEGQAQGIQRMLADERDCREVLNQLASVRAATRRVSLELMRYYMMSRLNDAEKLDTEEAVDDMITFLTRA